MSVCKFMKVARERYLIVAVYVIALCVALAMYMCAWEGRSATSRDLATVEQTYTHLVSRAQSKTPQTKEILQIVNYMKGRYLFRTCGEVRAHVDSLLPSGASRFAFKISDDDGVCVVRVKFAGPQRDVWNVISRFLKDCHWLQVTNLDVQKVQREVQGHLVFKAFVWR